MSKITACESILDNRKHLATLGARMDKTEEPDKEDIGLYRELATQTHGSIQSVVQSLTEQLVERITRGGSRACVLAEMDALKRDLGYEQAPTLERLLIDHIIATRARVIDIENRYNLIRDNIIKGNIHEPSELEEFFDALLSSAHARYIRAIESLARVRRLAVRTPNLQVNIAHSGGRQRNTLKHENG